VVLLLLSPLACCAETDSCADDRSCRVHVKSLVDELDAVGADMKGKRRTLESLDRFRRSVASGVRIELPTAQREHLERANALVSEVSFDTKHRPISTNLTRHVHRSRLVANSTQVRLHVLMPIKPKTLSAKAGPFTLLVAVGVDGRLSMHSVTTGDLLVNSMHLGHPARVHIRHLVVSQGINKHFVLSAGDYGEIHVHSIKVVAKKADSSMWASPPAAEKGESDNGENRTELATGVEGGHALEKEKVAEPEATNLKNPQEQVPEELWTRISDRKITISVNFSRSLRLPLDNSGPTLKLTSVLSVERDDVVYFVAGDSRGGISIFHEDGRLKGRTKLTEDPGGIRGLVRGLLQQVVFFSSHSFGIFSVSQMDMPFESCSGWTAPLMDMILDPNHANSRAFLALADGDVLVFSLNKQKDRACELLHKFPRVSRLPFKLQMWNSHVVGMQMAQPEAAAQQHTDHLRELFFFNTVAMDAVHGDVASRIITAQLNFRPRRLEDFAINGIPGMAAGERSRAQLALRYIGENGVELSELTLQQPPALYDVNAGGGESWLTRFPKITVFAVAVLGVVLWNVRKARWSKKSAGESTLDDESTKETSNDSKEDDSQHGQQSGEESYEDRPKIEEIFDD